MRLIKRIHTRIKLYAVHLQELEFIVVAVAFILLGILYFWVFGDDSGLIPMLLKMLVMVCGFFAAVLLLIFTFMRGLHYLKYGRRDKK